MNEYTLHSSVQSWPVSQHCMFALMDVNGLNIVDALGFCLILAHVLNFQQRILLMTLIPINDNDYSPRRIFLIVKNCRKEQSHSTTFFPYIFSILCGLMDKKSLVTVFSVLVSSLFPFLQILILTPLSVSLCNCINKFWNPTSVKIENPPHQYWNPRPSGL
jgi:hypothetical protein